MIQKRMEFFKTYTEDMHHDNNLLKTIRIPKNLLFLTDRLPQANYNNKKNLPDDKKKKFQPGGSYEKESNIISTDLKKEEKKIEKKEDKKSLQQILNDNEVEAKKIERDQSPIKQIDKDKIKEKEVKEKDKDNEKSKEEKEKKQNILVSKVYNINQSVQDNSDLPNINKGNYQYNK